MPHVGTGAVAPLRCGVGDAARGLPSDVRIGRGLPTVRRFGTGGTVPLRCCGAGARWPPRGAFLIDGHAASIDSSGRPECAAAPAAAHSRRPLESRLAWVRKLALGDAGMLVTTMTKATAMGMMLKMMLMMRGPLVCLGL